MTLPNSPRPLVERFAEAVRGVAGHCTIVRDRDAAAEHLRALLAEVGARQVAVSDSPLVADVIARVDTTAEVITHASQPQLFASDVGVTSAQWAIAETGTLVLDSAAERHRLASLVPPVHVVLLDADRIRPAVAHVLAEIGTSGPDDLGSCVTFVTGPSRTSDIELTLAIGVHGPRDLHVIVIRT